MKNALGAHRPNRVDKQARKWAMDRMLEIKGTGSSGAKSKSQPVSTMVD
jgi:hypothetical protein